MDSFNAFDGADIIVQRFENVALLMARAACAFAETCGMVAENQDRLSRGETIAYPNDAFRNVVLENGIGHNDAIGLLRQDV